MIAQEAKRQRDEAQILYLLSLLSPFVALTGFGFFIMPLVILVFVISAIASRRAFVRWHAAQWALINIPILTFVALVLIVASFNLSGICIALMILILGFIANVIGWVHARRGECWLWGAFDANAELPRVPDAISAPNQVSSRADTRREAIAHWMRAFRQGAPDERWRAVAELEKLGEVEIF